MVAEPPLTEPPPEATAKVRVTPETGLSLASVTSTLGSVATAVPTVAAWPPPAFAVILPTGPAVVVKAVLAPVRELPSVAVTV